MDLFSDPFTIAVIAFSVIIAITFHEAAHGIVAWRLGDDTAYRMGRVTLNPLKHIDAFGTILLPAILLLTKAGFLFGWAKPVPVQFGRLRQPRRDMVLVAAAGPGINLLLAVVSALLIHLVPLLPHAAGQVLEQGLVASIFINVILAVFNMLPLPPLDGGRVAVGLLPDALAFPLAKLERWGMLIIIGILVVPPLLGPTVGVNVNVFTWIILPVVEYVINLILGLTGVGLGQP